MIEIDRIGPGRATQLAGLQALTFRQAYADVHSQEDIEAYCSVNYTHELANAQLLADRTICCIGLLDSEPSGYYLVKHEGCPVALGSESSELKQIYVLNSAYGSGLGRALYDHAVETIRSAGRDWVWLCVSDINYRAQAFYAKLGFLKVGTGPVLVVGVDELPSSILAREL